MEFFTATGKMRKFFFFWTSRDVRCVHHMLTCVWQELEYRIDVCCVTCGAHIEHIYLSKKLSHFSCGCEKFH